MNLHRTVFHTVNHCIVLCLIICTTLLYSCKGIESGPVSLETPLTIEAVENGELNLSTYSLGSVSIEYCINRGNRQMVRIVDPVTINLSKGDKVELFGDNEKAPHIRFTQKFYVYGNVMSVLHSTSYSEQTTIEALGAFQYMLSDNDNMMLHDSKELLLPAKRLSKKCYMNMFAGCTSLTSTPELPAKILAEECYEGMFAGCTSLTSVIYLGSYDPTEKSAKDIFKGCDKLKFVCVSSCYNGNSFCRLNQFCNHESCESFLLSSNQCYGPVCYDNNNTISMEKRENAVKWESRNTSCYEFQCHNDSGLVYWKRDNATIWESKTTGCYEFQCHNNSGPIYWKQCSEADEVCENDQCVANDEVTLYVEIEVEGIDVTDFKMTEIQNTISDLTGIEADEL